MDADEGVEIHRVRDYTGSGQEEKQERIREIVAIGVDNGYTHLFAGYGFMAEDADFIAAIEAVLDPGSGAPKTRDLGGKASTTDLGRAVADALSAASAASR